MFASKSIFIKVITLQLLWYALVFLGPLGYLGMHIITLAFLFYLVNLKFYTNQYSNLHNFIILFFFIAYGFFETIFLNKLGYLSFNNFPYWIIGLYIIFYCYYGDLFNYLSSKSTFFLAIIGAIGGSLSFYAGVNIAKLTVVYPDYYIGIAIMWSVFFPLGIKMYYSKDIKDRLLDFSIYYSFDKSGFIRHKKNFSENIQIEHDKNILISGGTSGIGLSIAKQISGAKSNAFVFGRDLIKGKNVSKDSNNIIFQQLDLQDWDEFDAVVENLPVLSALVLNAGGMPENFSTNNYGVESQMASQLFGHYFLLKKLYLAKKLVKGSKVVWVSSGGMYLKKLTLENIFKNEKYDKVSTYANVKRAQVELLEYFKNEFNDLIIVGMHPGWVDTPGIQTAISGFSKFMSNKLRTPDQGADTICWLLSKNTIPETGKFYFDRNVVKKNAFYFTKSNNNDVAKLFTILNDYFEKLSLHK